MSEELKNKYRHSLRWFVRWLLPLEIIVRLERNMNPRFVIYDLHGYKGNDYEAHEVGYQTFILVRRAEQKGRAK